MAVAKFKKINIIAHQDYKKDILELLYDRGFIEVISPTKEDEEIDKNSQPGKANTEYNLAKVKYAIEFLSPYSPNNLSFFAKLNYEKTKTSIKEIKSLKREFDYVKAAEAAEELSQRLNILKSLTTKLEEERKMLTPWQNLNLKTGEDLETDTTKTILGTIEEKKYDILHNTLIKKYSELEILKINNDGAAVYFFIIYSKNHQKDLLPLLTSSDFKAVELPGLKVTPADRIKEINRELKKTEEDISVIKKQATGLSEKNLGSLEIIFDFLTWQFQQEQIQDKVIFTESAFFVLGWIKARKIPELEQMLKKITNSVEIVILKSKADEPMPISMENTALIKPFEFVTNIYGYPKHSEVDPTPFLAGFFILFFGLCLTDAGYGITLMLASFLALRFLKLSTDLKKLVKVLFYGGIVTFFAGGLTGGWFGIVLEELPAALSWLAKPLIMIRQIDPVKDPITILIISLILGYIHLLFGNAINLWWKIKHGEIKEGLVSSGVWMYFLLAVGFWIITSQDIALVSLKKLALYSVYLSMLLVIFTQGKSKNIIMKIFGGLSGLYFGVTGYISDILSYSRLLALGLATGIIGMVINIIGSMANEMVPFVGWLLMLFIIIGGHIFNLVLSLVGAFIHSGRLQYVEFFKSFFEGGGKQFNPFIRESRYIRLIKNNRNHVGG